MDTTRLQSILESLLFVQGEPIHIAKLAQVAGVSEEEIEISLAELTTAYDRLERGLALVKKEGMVQLVTRPENASVIESFMKSAAQESLSKAALEVLSVVAYRGPIARADIEAIRGVNCSVTLRNLLMRELIERKGNPDDARGYVYSISFHFLRELGLKAISDLPDYEMLARDERLESVLGSESGESNSHATVDPQ